MGDVTGPLSDGLSDQEREQPRGAAGGGEGAGIQELLWTASRLRSGANAPVSVKGPAPTCLRPMAPGPRSPGLWSPVAEAEKAASEPVSSESKETVLTTPRCWGQVKASAMGSFALLIFLLWCSGSVVSDSEALWTVARRAPLSTEFSR